MYIYLFIHLFIYLYSYLYIYILVFLKCFLVRAKNKSLDAIVASRVDFLLFFLP